MATGNKHFEEIHIEITNPVTTEEYLNMHIQPTSNSFSFNQPYTARAGISYKIRVIADKASGNSTAKSVEVSCN